MQEGGYRVRTLGTNVRSFFEGLVKGASAPTTPPPRPVSPKRKSSAAASREKIDPATISWRDFVTSADEEAIRSLVAATGFFTTEEIDIAAELVRERVSRGPSSGYEFIVAEIEERIAGYACFGQVAGSDVAHDLYWIASAPQWRGRGLGPMVLRRVEAAVAALGGRQIYADTSSSAKYADTRRFYLSQGFRQQALLPDFYRRGDGKIIFEKRI